MRDNASGGRSASAAQSAADHASVRRTSVVAERRVRTIIGFNDLAKLAVAVEHHVAKRAAALTLEERGEIVKEQLPGGATGYRLAVSAPGGRAEPVPAAGNVA